MLRQLLKIVNVDGTKGGRHVSQSYDFVLVAFSCWESRQLSHDKRLSSSPMR